MDTQTSFIPKQPLVKASMVRNRPIGLLGLLCALVFFFSLISGTGAFLYKVLLKKEIAQMEATLTKTEQAFDRTLIEKLERLDHRIIAAKELLERHVVVSSVFTFIESSTIPNVRFNKFNYTTVGEDKRDITLSGQASSYAYIAVQSDIIGKGRYIKEHVFSNLTLDNTGKVVFDLNGTVDPSLVSYKETLERQSQGIQ